MYNYLHVCISAGFVRKMTRKFVLKLKNKTEINKKKLFILRNSKHNTTKYQESRTFRRGHSAASHFAVGTFRHCCYAVAAKFYHTSLQSIKTRKKLNILFHNFLHTYTNF